MLLNHVNGVLEVLIDVAVKRSLERHGHHTHFFFPISCQKSHIIVNRFQRPFQLTILNVWVLLSVEAIAATDAGVQCLYRYIYVSDLRHPHSLFGHIDRGWTI